MIVEVHVLRVCLKILDEYARLPFAGKQICLMLAGTSEESMARSSMCSNHLLWLCGVPVVDWSLKQANTGLSVVLLRLLAALPPVCLEMFSDLDTSEGWQGRQKSSTTGYTC
jgi:hypothetical protein